MKISTCSAPFALVSTLLLCGCGGSASPPPNSGPTVESDAANIASQLRGNWRLVDYRSELPLEATFQALLMMQTQSMTIRFENGQLLADSPTIHIHRAFRITEAAGPNFRFTAVDETGTQIVSTCQFSDDRTQIFFHGVTEPWRGNGTLRRQ